MSSNQELQRKTSAVSLSDMEMFIFPELIYSLVLANLMSPCIWKWREDPWFAGLERMKPYRRITRLKQYIMNHYAFNLDLNTWGLTTKQEQLARFSDFIDEDTLAHSNALFGYEGDKYYFDLDIRTHFGLDKYVGEVIPYWKTETVEAMDAFQYKENYNTGAGECVSLAALYAAALFLVARIPLKDIYLMATPLHSQNYVDLDDGLLTNNRRLVTKNMWFNGTPLSGQARRALEKEKVTLIAHETGCIHTIYDEATISPEAYSHFSDCVGNYLKTDINAENMGNFIRQNHEIQQCFQICWAPHGSKKYIPAERVFAYEHGSPYRINDNTRDKLLSDIYLEEFSTSKIPERVVLNDIEDYLKKNRVNIDRPEDIRKLKDFIGHDCLRVQRAVDLLITFCRTEPQLPETEGKTFITDQKPLALDFDMGREEMITHLESLRDGNRMADMAFYAYRDLNRTEAEPFVLAAIQRNPVTLDKSRELTLEQILERLDTMEDCSIYDEQGRLAQPDEVWNFHRGDGAEKALVLANILRHRNPLEKLHIAVDDTEVILYTAEKNYTFASCKGIRKQTWQIPDGPGDVPVFLDDNPDSSREE